MGVTLAETQQMMRIFEEGEGAMRVENHLFMS